LKGYDSRLMTLNLLYLALIVLIPFTTDVLGDYAGQTDAVALYASNMAVVGVVASLMVAYALRAGLVREEDRSSAEISAGLGDLAIPAVFLLSIPFAVFVSADWAPVIWILVFFVHPRTRSRLRRPRPRSS
jgi:TMEM175 potassium channel family protein